MIVAYSSWKGGIFWEGGVYSGRSHIVVEKEGIFWEGGVDSVSVAHINWLKHVKRGVYSGAEGQILGWEGGLDSGEEGVEHINWFERGYILGERGRIWERCIIL